MPDPSTYRPAPGTIPLEPGVRKFRDGHGRVIYVGKAEASVEWTVVSESCPSPGKTVLLAEIDDYVTTHAA